MDRLEARHAEWKLPPGGQESREVLEILEALELLDILEALDTLEAPVFPYHYLHLHLLVL